MNDLRGLSAADCRAELARLRVAHYVFAARVGMHPSLLTRKLNEWERIPPDLAERMVAVLEELRQEREQR